LAIRRKGTTATDAGKIVGLSPYGCAEDVRLDKMGAGLPFIEHDRVKWGNLLEDPIRKDYADRHGVTSVEGETLKHPTEPWALATPDSLIYERRDPMVASVGSSPSWGHEIKTHTSWLSHLYGEPGTDQVPPWELIQCAWNIWVCSAHYGVELHRWDLTVFLDGLPTDYTIWRDEELEASLVAACRKFWEVHVIGGEPVPPDGSEHYGNILKSRFPQHDEDAIKEPTEAQIKLIRDLREARATRKEWETEEERIAQEVKLIMGTSGTLQWPEVINGKEKLQRINWKLSKESQRVDHKAKATELERLAKTLAHYVSTEHLPEILGAGAGEDVDQALEEIEARHTTTKPGSRRFTVPRSWSAK